VNWECVEFDSTFDIKHSTLKFPVDLSSLYQQVILKHYRQAPRRGDLDDPDATVIMRNPTCGDDIVLQLRVRDGLIEDIRFKGQGCAISQASASMMTQMIAGKSFAEAKPLFARFREMIHGDEAAAKDKELGELRALSGVAKLPQRVKCAMLAWDAFEEAEKQLREPER
jgi:nitrogen fixation protein NifU and related proteins